MLRMTHELGGGEDRVEKEGHAYSFGGSVPPHCASPLGTRLQPLASRSIPASQTGTRQAVPTGIHILQLELQQYSSGEQTTFPQRSPPPSDAPVTAQPVV